MPPRNVPDRKSAKQKFGRIIESQIFGHEMCIYFCNIFLKNTIYCRQKFLVATKIKFLKSLPQGDHFCTFNRSKSSFSLSYRSFWILINMKTTTNFGQYQPKSDKTLFLAETSVLIFVRIQKERYERENELLDRLNVQNWSPWGKLFTNFIFVATRNFCRQQIAFFRRNMLQNYLHISWQ